MHILKDFSKEFFTKYFTRNILEKILIFYIKSLIRKHNIKIDDEIFSIIFHESPTKKE